jgi:hypothetical protein
LSTIQQLLSGESAFYKQVNYKEVTREELCSSKPPSEPMYTHNTESKVARIARYIFSIFFFPLGIYKLIQFFLGKLLVPASIFFMKWGLDKYRAETNLDSKFKFKRIAIEVDGYTIDAAIIGQESTLENGRWMLSSNGNGEFYENQLHNHQFHYLLEQLKSNALVFNYPGVGASSRMATRNAMIKAYCALLTFLEDRKNGIGAKEIIGYGFSIGGGVQGEALRTHRLKSDIRYVFIKDRTFSDLRIAVSSMAHKSLGFLVKLLGWNMSSIASSKALEAPEIILQSANVSPGSVKDLSRNSELIVDDGVITKEATLAKKLLADQTVLPTTKRYFGISERHCVYLSSTAIESLAKVVQEMLLPTDGESHIVRIVA